jgi:dephospho-CoA kinase
MRVVALTGGIGSGKSLAAQYFAELGAFVIDADQLSREAIERGSKGFDEVVSIFGDSILLNGEINRKVLAESIFKDPQLKLKLEAIVHPFVRKKFEVAVSSLKEGEVLIYEIPLLVETKAHDRFDLVITVEAEYENRVERLRSRGMQKSEIDARIASQASRPEREEIADFLIENNGDQDELLRQVENIWDSISDSL